MPLPHSGDAAARGGRCPEREISLPPLANNDTMAHDRASSWRFASRTKIKLRFLARCRQGNTSPMLVSHGRHSHVVACAQRALQSQYCNARGVTGTTTHTAPADAEDVHAGTGVAYPTGARSRSACWLATYSLSNVELQHRYGPFNKSPIYGVEARLEVTSPLPR